MDRTGLRLRRILLLLLAAVLWACGGPVGPLAGGRLSGEVAPAAVTDWSFAQGEEQAQLETRPDDPYSVNTWFVGIGGDLYIPTSMILGPKDPSTRSWVKHVAADPEVRIRLGKRVYSRVAVRVADPDEYARARAALEAKYALDPAERDPEREVWLFRLDARGTQMR